MLPCRTGALIRSGTGDFRGMGDTQSIRSSTFLVQSLCFFFQSSKHNIAGRMLFARTEVRLQPDGNRGVFMVAGYLDVWHLCPRRRTLVIRTE